MKGIRYIVLMSLMSSTAYAGNADLDSLLSLSFKDLNKIKVTSVSKKEENSFEAPAAIFVITSDDIRRSGATSIPETLRMAPGIDVARIDSNKWAITSRGFNAQYSNKLLVLIDGRTVYTPHFSGVYWDVQDTLLEDIERIEIIRGPGATLWGANAVNGVINIITKNAQNTQGGYAETFAGNEETGTVAARYGGKTKDGLYYRVYGKYKEVDDSQIYTGLDADNSWHQSRAGFRADWDKNVADKFSVHGDMYRGIENQTVYLRNAIGAIYTADGDEKYQGGNLVSHWQHELSDKSSIDVQAYVDYIERNISVLNQERITFDVDFQHTWQFHPRHELIWGTGFRYFTDDLDEKSVNGVTYLNYTPDDSDNNLYSAFIQDKYAVVPDKLYLTVGSKVEHHYYTDWELQPNARISWLPTEQQTVWAAVSRAARTPTRGENGLSLVAVPNMFDQEGNKNYGSEYLTSYELGYRIQPSWKFLIDATIFYNDYDDLRMFQDDGQNWVAQNNAHGEANGFELSSRYSVTNDWNLYASYSFYNLDIDLNPQSSESALLGTSKVEVNEGKSPQNKFSLQSRVNLPHNIEFDNSIYLVENLTALNIPSYVRFDARIAWKPVEDLEFSLVGQNLFDDRHPEYEKALFSTPSEIERSIYGKVSYKF